jgi:pimeloyl-ACP methyl ester carboxylesterase
MLFIEHGDPARPTIILLHGGGLSDWSLAPVVGRLRADYHVVTPIIDGHGADSETTFVSIQESAGKLVRQIRQAYGGRVLLLGGLSLGAQIVVEALAQAGDIAEAVVIESALVHPIPGTRLIAWSYDLLYGLIKQRWFARAQARALFVPPADFERYFADSQRISKSSLVNITLSNGAYGFPDALAGNPAKALILVGSKELAAMRRSAQTIHERLPNSRLEVLEGLGHGQISLVYPDRFLGLLQEFASITG